jgi:hypothetical protein
MNRENGPSVLRFIIHAVFLAKRTREGDLRLEPIPSVMHPLGYAPDPSHYDTVAPGHRVPRNIWK